MVRKIVTAKQASLRQKSKAVTKIDKKIKDLIVDLKDTLNAQKEPEGVGLAAPQIGRNLRVFLLDYEGEKRIVINPEIISITKELKSTKNGKKEKDDVLEGCLSLPHYYGPLKRAEQVKIKYKDENGRAIEETFNGFLAQIVQHEIDHLDGILFIDHILENKTPLYKFNKKGEWTQVEI